MTNKAEIFTWQGSYEGYAKASYAAERDQQRFLAVEPSDEAKTQIAKDINRTPFFLLSQANHELFKEEVLKEFSSFQTFAQGDFMGGPFAPLYQAMLYEQRIERVDLISFGFLTDDKKFSGFAVSYRESGEWAVNIYEYGMDLDKSKENFSVVLPKNLKTPNTNWSSSDSTQWLDFLHSEPLKRIFKNLIRTDGTINLSLLSFFNCMLSVGKGVSDEKVEFFSSLTSAEWENLFNRLEELKQAGYFSVLDKKFSDSFILSLNTKDLESYKRLAEKVKSFFEDKGEGESESNRLLRLLTKCIAFENGGSLENLIIEFEMASKKSKLTEEQIQELFLALEGVFGTDFPEKRSSVKENLRAKGVDIDLFCDYPLFLNEIIIDQTPELEKVKNFIVLFLRLQERLIKNHAKPGDIDRLFAYAYKAYFKNDRGDFSAYACTNADYKVEFPIIYELLELKEKKPDSFEEVFSLVGGLDAIEAELGSDIFGNYKLEVCKAVCAFLKAEVTPEKLVDLISEGRSKLIPKLLLAKKNVGISFFTKLQAIDQEISRITKVAIPKLVAEKSNSIAYAALLLTFENIFGKNTPLFKACLSALTIYLASPKEEAAPRREFLTRLLLIFKELNKSWTEDATKIIKGVKEAFDVAVDKEQGKIESEFQAFFGNMKEAEINHLLFRSPCLVMHAMQSNLPMEKRREIFEKLSKLMDCMEKEIDKNDPNLEEYYRRQDQIFLAYFSHIEKNETVGLKVTLEKITEGNLGIEWRNARALDRMTKLLSSNLEKDDFDKIVDFLSNINEFFQAQNILTGNDHVSVNNFKNAILNSACRFCEGGKDDKARGPLISSVNNATNEVCKNLLDKKFDDKHRRQFLAIIARFVTGILNFFYKSATGCYASFFERRPSNKLKEFVNVNDMFPLTPRAKS